jgi:hypothetical protein
MERSVPPHCPMALAAAATSSSGSAPCVHPAPSARTRKRPALLALRLWCSPHRGAAGGSHRERHVGRLAVHCRGYGDHDPALRCSIECAVRGVGRATPHLVRDEEAAHGHQRQAQLRQHRHGRQRARRHHPVALHTPHSHTATAPTALRCELPRTPRGSPSTVGAACRQCGVQQCTARRSTRRHSPSASQSQGLMASSHLGRVTGVYHCRTLRVSSPMQPYPSRGSTPRPRRSRCAPHAPAGGPAFARRPPRAPTAPWCWSARCAGSPPSRSRSACAACPAASPAPAPHAAQLPPTHSAGVGELALC